MIADCPYAVTTTKEGIRCPLVIYIFISPQSGFNIRLNSTRPHLLSSWYTIFKMFGKKGMNRMRWHCIVLDLAMFMKHVSIVGSYTCAIKS